jgi:tetratricopeptide (TPR) repeat protein
MKFSWFRRQQREEDLDAKIRNHLDAIDKDPSFAPAYAGLALAYAFQSGQFQFDIADEAEKMRVAAEKAIQLDPMLAEAHDALGIAYARDGKWEQSERSFRRAIEIDPGRSESYAYFVTEFLLGAPQPTVADALTSPCVQSHVCSI